VYAACLTSEALTAHDALFFIFFQNDCGKFVVSNQWKTENLVTLHPPQAKDEN